MQANRKRIHWILITLFFICPNVFAIQVLPRGTSNATNPEVSYPDSWHFRLAPYFWLGSVHGHVNVNGTRANWSTPLSDTWQHVDFGAGGSFEAHQQQWTLTLDTAYLKVTQNCYIANVRNKATEETGIIDGGAYYRVFSKIASQQTDPYFSFELYGGGRVISVHTILIPYNQNNASTATDTSSTVAPLIGARIKYYFNQKTHFWFNGDVGGFKMGRMNSTWSATLGINHNLSKHFDIFIAHQLVGINYSKQVITINTLQQGPLIGFAYSW